MGISLKHMYDLKFKLKKMDFPLLIATVLLVMIGVMMIVSTSSTVGFVSYNDSYYFVRRHFMYLGLALVAMAVGIRMPHTWYRDHVWVGLVLATLLVILTMIPGIGVMAFGARRWLNLGFMTFQPVEVLKFFVIVFAAKAMSAKPNLMRSFKTGLFPFFCVVGVPLLITAKQPDLGNVLLMSSVIYCLLLIANAKKRHLFGALGVGATFVTISVLTFPYQLQRIKTFLNPFADPLGKSYHIIQSFTAIGSGGIWGRGLGEGKLKHAYLPLQFSDFIFSIICEEGGFILAVGVLGLLLWFLQRGFTIARRASLPFSYYLAVGLTLQIVLQSLINIAVATGVFPTKGIPLAFISFGGTSLMMSLFVVGVLLNISLLEIKRKDTHD